MYIVNLLITKVRFLRLLFTFYLIYDIMVIGRLKFIVIKLWVFPMYILANAENAFRPLRSQLK